MKLQGIKTQIRETISGIEPFDDLEKTHLDDALQWVKSGADIFRVAKPDKPPKHLVSYIVLIDPDHKSLLLGDHVTSQLWLPSGGHVEPGEHPKDTVVRETQEELGKQAVFLHGNDSPFFITVTQTNAFSAYHTDVSLWYLLRGSVHESIAFERREFNDMTWFTSDEILQSHPAIFDPHLQRFTEKLNQKIFDS
jgi:8-oxo-dGTP pyrophosphatase MutT (NUDIX family)